MKFLFNILLIPLFGIILINVCCSEVLKESINDQDIVDDDLQDLSDPIIHGDNQIELIELNVDESKSNPIFLNSRDANMNIYMDYLMARFGPWVYEVGGGAIELPDMVEDFEVRYILITYSATIYLWDGKMYDFHRATRVGNSIMSYNTQSQLIRIQTAASFNSMNFRYDYRSIFMNIGGWTGYVLGDVDNMVFSCDFVIDTWDFFIFMQNFHVVSIGNIDIRLRGNILTDWIGNAMISVITTLFRTRVTEHVSNVLNVFMQQAIDEMNERNFQQRLLAAKDLMQFAEAKANDGDGDGDDLANKASKFFKHMKMNVN